MQYHCRNPKERLSLEEIENHSWLTGARTEPENSVLNCFPLVTTERIPEDMHVKIIDKMIEGEILYFYPKINANVNGTRQIQLESIFSNHPCTYMALAI